MPKLKQQILVEISTNRPVTEQAARKLVHRMLENHEGAEMEFEVRNKCKITKISCKGYLRSMQGKARYNVD